MQGNIAYRSYLGQLSAIRTYLADFNYNVQKRKKHFLISINTLSELAFIRIGRVILLIEIGFYFVKFGTGGLRNPSI